MTDLLLTIPDFPTRAYVHLLPSLEKQLITTADLLTLDALEIAKRARVPLLDVRRLAGHVVAVLQAQLGVGRGDGDGGGGLRRSGVDVVGKWGAISTLDEGLDECLGGGAPTGYITEVVGESGVGKTQFLLTLLLSAQLPPPHGLSRPTLYISTEHPLPTTRLTQILQTHPLLSTHPSPPSLSQILTLQTPDLESQEHILTYQLPVALARHNIGLCIIDSIAANFRAETHSVNSASALAHRSAQLLRLGALLRSLARIHDCAFVVANQVADRFPPTHVSNRSINTPSSSPYPSAPALPHHSPPLSLDHQQRFFTGWGANPSSPTSDLKTPSLGLVWANQIDCRIALIKEAEYGVPRAQGGVLGVHSNPTGVDVGVVGDKAEAEEKSGAASRDEWRESAEWGPKRWRRWMRLVFAAWVRGTTETDKGAEFEIWAGGLRAVGGVIGDRANGPFEGFLNETE